MNTLEPQLDELNKKLENLSNSVLEIQVLSDILININILTTGDTKAARSAVKEPECQHEIGSCGEKTR